LIYAEMLKTWHQAIAISVLGIVEYQQGDFQVAHQRLTESLRRWRPVGDPRGLVFTMIYMGMTAIGLQDFAPAKSVLCESNQIAEANMDRWAHASGLDLLGIASMSQGQNEEALTYFQKSAALFNEIGDQMNGTQTAIHMGQVYAAMRSDDEAKRLFLEAFSNARSNKWAPLMINALVSLVEISNEFPLEIKLAVALSALAHPAITPNLRGRSETIRDHAKANLREEEIKLAESLAREKSPELWAQELMK
jgi:tetratricopeptide (TPR) repeat protein